MSGGRRCPSLQDRDASIERGDLRARVARQNRVTRRADQRQNDSPSLHVKSLISAIPATISADATDRYAHLRSLTNLRIKFLSNLFLSKVSILHSLHRNLF